MAKLPEEGSENFVDRTGPGQGWDRYPVIRAGIHRKDAPGMEEALWNVLLNYYKRRYTPRGMDGPDSDVLSKILLDASFERAIDKKDTFQPLPHKRK